MSRKILLIQDDLDAAKAVHDALSDSRDGAFQVEWLTSCSTAVERLIQEEKHDKSSANGIAAVLADLSLPDSQGIAAFDRLFAVAPRIPILIFCNAQDEANAKLAVQHGAQDYLFKNRLDNYLLPKTVSNMIERRVNADALFEEKERAQVTLDSIGDAVMSTDQWGNVTYLNAAAENLTGWSREEAAGQPLENVFHIIDATTRDPVTNPITLAIQQNRTVALDLNCLLIQRDGSEASIEDSTAPIHDRCGHVTGAVMVFRDVSAERELSRRMFYLAQHDSLTDLPNRLLLSDRLTQAMARAQRCRQQLAVLFLDVDRFKHINDSLGHGIGDRLLQAVARRLLASVRSSDTVSRQGGDEFVILLSEVTHAQDAAVTADKIILALRKPYRIDHYDLHLTVSIGIVTYPEDGIDAETLLKNADFAMYRAKDSGRDDYQFFKSGMNASVIERQPSANADRSGGIGTLEQFTMLRDRVGRP